MVSASTHPGPVFSDAPTSASRTPHSAFPLPLDPEAADLLSAILSHNLDLAATAAFTGIPLFILLDFAAQPSIASRLDTYRTYRLHAVNDKLLTHLADARIHALAELKKVIDSTEDPAERRRSARLILHYATPISYRARPPLPDGSEGRGVGSLDSRRASAPRSRGSRSSSFSYTRPLPPSSPPPSSLNPLDLITHVKAVFASHEPNNPTAHIDTLSALYACLAEHAWVNEIPAADRSDAFIHELDPSTERHLLGDIVQIQDRAGASTPTAHTHQIVLCRPAGDQSRLTLTLARDNPTTPWRIATLTAYPNSS